jgi:hypothetical protein
MTLDHELRVGTGTGTIFGGNVSVQAGGDVAVHRRIVADGKMDGGSIVVSSTPDSVALDQDLRARGHHGAGHSIEVDAAGVLTTGHQIDAHGVTGGGTICFKAASGDVSGTYLADGGNGAIRAVATGGGDLTLGGRFSARGGGGEIEASASGNLTAVGRFRVNPGCIALSAGGTVTTGGAFDTTVGMDCPGSCP